MTIWILAALLLYVVQTLLPPMFRYVLRSDPQILATLGARDTPPETSIYGARAERALGNMQEGLIVFVPLALLSQQLEGALVGAQIFVLARCAYVPIYILGVPVLRSAIWITGLTGLGLMAAEILSTQSGTI